MTVKYRGKTIPVRVVTVGSDKKPATSEEIARVQQKLRQRRNK